MRPYTSFQHTDTNHCNTNHCNERVCVQLKDQRFDHLYVSPLARARETADIIWEGRAPVKRHEPPVLREIDLYSFQAGPPAAGSRRAVFWHTLLAAWCCHAIGHPFFLSLLYSCSTAGPDQG